MKNVQGHGQSKPDIPSRLDIPRYCPKRLDLVTRSTSWKDGKAEPAHCAASVVFVMLLHLLQGTLQVCNQKHQRCETDRKQMLYHQIFGFIFLVSLLGKTSLILISAFVDLFPCCGQRRPHGFGGIRVPNPFFQ